MLRSVAASDGRKFVILFRAIAVVLALAGVNGARDARAESFDFWMGGNAFFSDVALQMTFLNTNGGYYNFSVDGVSGTFNGQTITGLLAPTTVTGHSFTNQMSFSADPRSASGPPDSSSPRALSNSSTTGFVSGFGFTTASTDVAVYAALDNQSSGNNFYFFDQATSNPAQGNYGGFGMSATEAAPLPLPGAGMLSYLAVILFGLYARGRVLVTRAQGFVAMVVAVARRRLSAREAAVPAAAALAPIAAA